MARGELPIATAGSSAAMGLASVLKQNELSKMPANLPGQHGHILAKGCEEALQGDTYSPSNLEANGHLSRTLESIDRGMKEVLNTVVMRAIPSAATWAVAFVFGVVRHLLVSMFIAGGDAVSGVALFIATCLRLILMENRKHVNDGDPPPGVTSTTTISRLRAINSEMVILRIKHLRNVGVEPQARHKDFIIEYFRRAKAFVVELEVSTLDEVLCKQTDLLFLQQLLVHMEENSEATKAQMPSSTTLLPTGDLVLEALAAAPPCCHRTDVELLHKLSMTSCSDVSLNTGGDASSSAE